MSNRLLSFTTDRLLHILQALPVVRQYLVGFSGGADSSALLFALSKLQNQLTTPVSAVHVNHGLHQDADLWQQHCEDFCAQHVIGLTCLKIDLSTHSGKGQEATARYLRYQAISALLGPNDCLLTAHHANDQAETVLLNLMRGSGVDGLTAMPKCRALGSGVLQRPLLSFQSSALRSYLHNNNVSWLEDPSNQVLSHDRNFLRHEIIPRLESRWPELGKRLLLTRKTMAGTRSLLESIADEYLQQHLPHPLVLNVSPRLKQTSELLHLVVRRWLKQSNAPSIPACSLHALSGQVQKATSSHKIVIRWGGWLLRLYQQNLWLHMDVKITACPSVKWPAGSTGIDLGEDLGLLRLQGRCLATLPEGFSVGSRRNNKNDVIQLGKHHHKLKNLFQSAGIPPWLRDSIPLCKLNDELVAIGDWCCSEWFAGWLSENQSSLSWHPQNPLLQFILTQQGSRGVDPAGVVR